MSEKATGHVSQLQSTQQREKSVPDEAEWKHGYGAYQWCEPTQDQVKFVFKEGKISGIFTPISEDSQSDYTKAPSVQMHGEASRVLVKELLKKFDNRAWNSGKSSADEELARSVVVEEQVGGQDIDIDTTTDDVLQWTSDQLATAIMHPKAESDMPRLRKMILVAEDTGFTVDQSKQLAPWLLSFAERQRDSSDPQNEVAVWSAIRTGASMLTPHDVNNLHALLEPGHSIETSLVTVKMLGRIFEAQPPAEVDKHPVLANEVFEIAECLLNRHAITISQSAAKAQLAIYALAAMASSETQRIIEVVQGLGVPWFARRTLRKLRDLRNIWTSRPVPVAERPRELLAKALQTLERD